MVDSISNAPPIESPKGYSHIKKWLDESGVAESELLRDAHECAQNFTNQSLDAQDKTQWLLQSDEINRFLSSPTSQVLLIDAETPPDDLTNPLSFTSAFLAETLPTTKYPTLVYMAGIRANESVSEEVSGPLAMTTSLNAQLLRNLADNKPGIDLSFLVKKSTRRKSRSDLSASLRLFQRLLDTFAPEDTIFVIIDSVISLTGPQDEAEEAIESILEAADHAEPTTKVLLSGLAAPFLSALDEKGHPILYLPDYVDGHRQGVPAELLGEETHLSIEEFRSSQRKTSSEDEDTSSADSDSSIGEDGFVFGK